MCTTENSSDRYFAVSDINGHIVVYDTKDLLKGLMRVQLQNESEYNKEHKIQIESLSFYYRNHKHVLYGSFIINNEIFIFSFNIFDIFKSYQSSKLTKSTMTQANGKATTGNSASSNQQKSKLSSATVTNKESTNKSKKRATLQANKSNSTVVLFLQAAKILSSQ